MDEIPISKFKATCLAVLEQVRRTGKPIRVTRFGRAVADVIPPQAGKPRKFQLGGLEGKMLATGDIVSPVVDTGEWEVLRDETAAGYTHLDLERVRARKAPAKNPRRSSKR